MKASQRESFYYYPPSAGRQNTARVTSQIEMNALAQGRADFWIELDDAYSKRKKKTIVLADWSLNDPYNTSLAESVLNTLKALLREEFDIKIIKEGVLADVHHASDISFEKITPLHTHEIKKMLAEQNISSDQSYIFDYATVRNGVLYFADLKKDLSRLALLRNVSFNTISLMKDTQRPSVKTPTTEATTTASLISTVLSTISPTETIKIIDATLSFIEKQSKTPTPGSTLRKITGLYLSAYARLSSLKASMSQVMKIDLSALETMELYYPNHIDEKNISTLIENALNLTTIYLDTDIHLILPALLKLKSLKKMFLYEKITAADLSMLLSNIPTLEKITIPRIVNDLIIKTPLNNLKKIDLNHSDINTKNLLALLSKTPNLEKIDLSSCKNIQDDLRIHIPLKKLKNINLKGSTLTSKSLSLLLAMSPNVEKINLCFCKDTENNLIINGQLHHLREIDLSNSTLTIESLSTLISSAPNLEKLDLFGITSIENNLKIQIPLNHLKEVILSYSTLTAHDLSLLLLNTPNLKTLYLTDCHHIQSNLQIRAPLHKLTEIRLGYSAITSKSLSTLLANTPNLEALDLHDCHHIQGLLKIPNALDKLRKICLANSNISSKSLSALLSNAVHLEEINLSGCNNIREAMSISHTYPNLLEINLLDTPIPSENLSLLLSNTPHLEKINLSHCIKLKENLEIHHPNNNLKEIDLSSSAITIKNLSTLLSHARNLEKINLSHCDHTPGDLTITTKLNKLKEVDLSGTSITTENLCALFFKASNLEKINLSGCRYINDTLTMTPLQKLKEIHLEESAITSKSLSILFSNAPHLEKINLSRCCLTQDLVVDDQLRLTHLKEIDYRNARISEKNLEILHRIAPNAIFRSKADKAGPIPNGPNIKKELEKLSDKSLNSTLPKTQPSQTEPPQATTSTASDETTNEVHTFTETQGKNGARSKINSGGKHTPIHLQPGNTSTDTHDDLGDTESEETEQTETSDDSDESYEKESPRLTPPYVPPLPTPEIIRRAKHAILSTLYEAPIQTIEDFFSCVLQSTHPSQLIDCDTTQHANAFSFLLHARALSQRLPVFYANRIEQLSCLSPRLRLNEQDCAIRETQIGGDLYDFLQQTNEKRILLLDLRVFNAKQRIQINTLFDKPPKIDGVELPEGTLIIAIDNLFEKNTYRGPDFLSRFKCHRTLPHTLTAELDKIHEALEASLTMHPIETSALLTATASEATDTTAPVISIELFDDPLLWRSLLEGKWHISEILRFEENQTFIAALQCNTPLTLVLRNPPWQDLEFTVTWRKLYLERTFHYLGRSIAVSPHVQFKIETGYDWAQQLTGVTWLDASADLSSHALEVINQYNLATFFQQYQEKKGILHTVPSVLEAYKDGPLTLMVTQALTAGQWSSLFTQAQQHHISLRFILKGTAILLPTSLAAFVPTLPPHDTTAPLTHHSFCIAAYAPDPEKATQHYLESHPTTTPITCISLSSVFNAQFVLPHLHVTPDRSTEKEVKLCTQTLITQIWQKLQAGEHVILKGPLTEALTHTLLPLTTGFAWISGERVDLRTLPGKLIIFSNSPPIHLFPGSSAQTQATTSTFFNAPPSALLQTRPKAPTPLDATWYQHPQQKTEVFDQQRAKQVADVLIQHPWVVLVGPTGVGKTAFINRHYPQAYWGKEKIKEWLEDKTGGTLFLDEANLETDMDWLFLADLQQFPPVVWFEGKVYPLTKAHKVIFACNPLHYGGERALPDLFKHHIKPEAIVVFDDLPLASLYQCNIAPFLKRLALPLYKQEYIAQCFMNTYQSVLRRLPQAREYFTARQLQMMSILFASQYQRLSQQYSLSSSMTLSLAKACEYHVIKSALPNTDFTLLKQEGILCKEKITWGEFKVDIKRDVGTATTQQDQPVSSTSSPQFVFTAEHQNALDLLHPLLAARDQYQSGLPGLVYEGPSGIGKSHFILWLLEKEGYKQARLHASPFEKNQKHFYHLPINAPHALKQQVILRAFHEGAVLVMDECNAQALMEKLFNAVLSGQDLEGNPPKRPGFLFIGTQNPVSFSGRQSLSKALSNRCLKVKGHDYKKESLLSILKKNAPTLSHMTRDAIAAGFVKAQKHQQKHQKTASTFRNLFAFAQQVAQGNVTLTTSPAASPEIQAAPKPPAPAAPAALVMLPPPLLARTSSVKKAQKKPLARSRRNNY